MRPVERRSSPASAAATPSAPSPTRANGGCASPRDRPPSIRFEGARSEAGGCFPPPSELRLRATAARRTCQQPATDLLRLWPRTGRSRRTSRYASSLNPRFVFEAGFLEARIDGVGGSLPHRGFRADQRGDLGLAQFEATVAEREQRVLGIPQELRAEFFVRDQ